MFSPFGHCTNMLGHHRLHVNMLSVRFSDFISVLRSVNVSSQVKVPSVCVGDICALSLLEKLSHATII